MSVKVVWVRITGHRDVEDGDPIIESTAIRCDTDPRPEIGILFQCAIIERERGTMLYSPETVCIVFI